MKSTIDFPIKYFENYLDKEIFKDLTAFYSSFENEFFGHRIKRIDKNLHLVEYYKDSYNNDEKEYTTASFESQIIGKLKNEKSLTEEFIELGFQKRFSNKAEMMGYAKFLYLKLDSLEDLRAIKEFNFLNSLIQDLRETIRKYSDLKDELEVNNGIDEKDKLIKYTVGQENELILEVFGFMAGLNEKRERIMTDEQYDLMINYIKKLVKDEKLPEIKVKLNKVKISNELLSYSFWVLHNQLYTTTKIRQYFIEFLKLAFENFKNKEVTTIKSGFGTKGRFPIDDFIPQIIKQYL
ncbi:MAG: hypothetical protein KDC67_15125 [Ignavibacteriae bacterium]|nr:hypothetical protein [Ignavibacteriota bacterium]